MQKMVQLEVSYLISKMFSTPDGTLIQMFLSSGNLNIFTQMLKLEY
jgi:hypothetical protein